MIEGRRNVMANLIGCPELCAVTGHYSRTVLRLPSPVLHLSDPWLDLLDHRNMGHNTPSTIMARLRQNSVLRKGCVRCVG